MDQALKLPTLRQSKLLDELSYALKHTSQADLYSWAGRSIVGFVSIANSRVQNVGTLVSRIGTFAYREGKDLIFAVKSGRSKAHWVQRRTTTLQGSRALRSELRTFRQGIARQLKSDPAGFALRLGAGVLGLHTGSGGIDGDGGVPDLDLILGIGDHRSILTHSVIPGILIQATVMSFLDLSKTIYSNLPDDHDQIWEHINHRSDQVLRSLTAGLSLGIAYHLGIDATVDGGGVYKDLPFSLSQEGHQTIAAVNAASEGVAGAKGLAGGQRQEIQKFATFKAAADAAKRQPGATISRLPDGSGFRLTARRI